MGVAPEGRSAGNAGRDSARRGAHEAAVTVERLPVKPRRTRAAACPICGRAASRDHRPFCSGRCREVDLGRWFSGSYAIPAVEPPDGADLEELIEAAETAPEADDPG